MLHLVHDDQQHGHFFLSILLYKHRLGVPNKCAFTSVWAKIAKNYSAQMFLETIKAKYIFVGMKLQADALLVLVFVDKRIRLSPDSSLQTGLYLILGL